MCVSGYDFEYANFLFNQLIDLIEKSYKLCRISYDANKYFNKRAWLLVGKKLHDEIIQFNDSKKVIYCPIGVSGKKGDYIL